MDIGFDSYVQLNGILETGSFLSALEKKIWFIKIVADGVFYVGLLMVLVMSMSFTEAVAGRNATCLN